MKFLGTFENRVPVVCTHCCTRTCSQSHLYPYVRAFIDHHRPTFIRTL